MRAVRYAPPGVELVEVDEPEGEGELIKVTGVGICASDFNYIRYGSRQIAGHEIAGELEDGTPVAVEGIFGCGACEWCERGDFNLCARAILDIVGLTVPGGMAEYYRAPHVRSGGCRRVGPGGRITGRARLGGVARLPYGWRRSRHPGGRRRRGCDRDSRGAGGAGPGSHRTWRSRRATITSERSASDSGGRAGRTLRRGDRSRRLGERASRAVELARPAAPWSTIGNFGPDVDWPHRAAFVKEVRTAPSLGYCGHDGHREFDEVAAMLASRPDIAEALITHRFGIEDAVHAFDVARERSMGTFRVVVHP